MQTKFKRHDRVRILIDVNPEYVEYVEDDSNKIPIVRGMEGEINIILPNGKYHVKILDKKGNIFAYAPIDEEYLELI